MEGRFRKFDKDGNAMRLCREEAKTKYWGKIYRNHSDRVNKRMVKLFRAWLASQVKDEPDLLGKEYPGQGVVTVKSLEGEGAVEPTRSLCFSFAKYVAVTSVGQLDERISRQTLKDNMYKFCIGFLNDTGTQIASST